MSGRGRSSGVGRAAGNSGQYAVSPAPSGDAGSRERSGPTRGPRPTRSRAEAFAAAGEAFAQALRLREELPPGEAARIAWTPTYGGTVDDLEEQIRVSRGLPRREAAS